MKKSLKITLIVLGVLIGIFIITLGIIIFHNYLYKDNFSISKYQMKIINESTSCTEDTNKFYEDDLYTYYYSCASSDKVYAIFNNKDKYLVKDVFNNIPYKVKIKDVEKALKDATIDYIRKNKYQYITFDTGLPKINNSYITPDIEVMINNAEILDYKLDKEREVSGYGIYGIDLHLIPLKSGNTNIYITFKNPENNEVIDAYEYNVSIDNELNVKYEVSFTKLNCLNNILESYIVSEKNKVINMKLEDVINVNLTKIKSYTAKTTDKGNIYVVIDTLDGNILKEIDNYFKQNYSNYQTVKFNNYNIYLFNGNTDFNLQNDLKDACK